MKIKKRNGSLVDFNINNISDAIFMAMQDADEGSYKEAKLIANKVKLDIESEVDLHSDYIPSVEDIQDIVEINLMSTFKKTAKVYIIYRNQKSEERKTDIFKKRINLKPYEYPQLYEYVPAIRHSYWIHTEFNFTSDIQDFKTKLTKQEQSAIKNAMLAISQVEVAVKSFWGDIHQRMPKPEIGAVGATFAESEVRHADAYSHLLEILGLNEEFKNLKKNPIVMGRVRFLENILSNISGKSDREYSDSMVMFSLFIEHVSLFSQFLIIMAFNKHKNMLKGISNVVEATSKEEQIHGDFGIDLVKIIKNENPDWFNEASDKSISEMCKDAFYVESKIVDWIFEDGELDFLPKDVVKEFIKDRFNRSLDSLGIEKVFETDKVLLDQTEWFDDEIIGTKHGDFFVKRSINYSKRAKSITSDDLF